MDPKSINLYTAGTDILAVVEYDPTHPCHHGIPDKDKPMCYRSTPWHSDNCRKEVDPDWKNSK